MMKRYIKSSYGDINLSKFVFIPSDKIEDVETTKYDENLHGYLYLWTYTYNKLTRHTDDWRVSHSDVIDSLPLVLRKKDRMWGRVDYFPTLNSRSLFIAGDIEPSDQERKYLERLCNV